MRILVVDDYEPWRRFVCSTLGNRPELEVVGELSDGLEAVHKTQELQPDLILLDIGLPTLNGIEAARRMLQLTPQPKILFVSENHAADIALEALRAGGSGYVVKSNAASELLPAVNAVLEGRRFVSKDFEGPDFVETSYPPASESIPMRALGPGNGS
jgi:DNA-binding NarL/FixJ family response regulator